MKHLLILSPGADIAGGGIALKRAFDLHAPGWQARAVRRRNTVWDYPADLVWTAHTQRQVHRLFRDADVVHVWEQPDVVRQFAGWRGKHIVVQHVGSRFRSDPVGVSASCAAIGAVEAVGSHELLNLAPRGQLVIGAAAFEVLAGRHRPGALGVLRIAHAPTNRVLKSTEIFLAAVQRLGKRHPVEVDVIEGVSWAECIERKAWADVYYDQLHLGYGGNAIEAWGMGLPVVVGVDEPARSMMLAAWGSLPFVEATEESIEFALESLTVPAVRQEWGQRGYQFAERIHSERAVAERMLGLYHTAFGL